MKGTKNRKGSLTIEASISYSVFLMVIVTILYIMRIVYAYGLIQHAAAQTAKELSMYTYIYQVTGLSDMNQGVQGAASGRTEQFNSDVGSVVNLYDKFMAGDVKGVTEWEYGGTTNPKEIFKNVAAALVGQGGAEVNQLLFESVVRPLIGGYIGADSQGNGANERLLKLGVQGGLSGLNLNSSSFCEDGVTIDLVVCYTLDPVMPIDIMPEMNLMNRAHVRGMNGTTVFERNAGAEPEKEPEQKVSVWDQDGVGPAARGKIIQEEEGVRNLPDNFPTYAGFDASTGKATAAHSIDLRDSSYQSSDAIKRTIKTNKINKMNDYESRTYAGVTLNKEDIKSQELILYIPSTTDQRQVDRTEFDKAVQELRMEYPDIDIVVKEID